MVKGSNMHGIWVVYYKVSYKVKGGINMSGTVL